MTALNAAGYVLDAGDGEHIWFSGTLMSVKAGGEQTRDGFTLIEVSTPHRYVVPPHIHDDEEEAFYILEGPLRVSCGEQTWTVGPGDFVLMRRGIPHACATLGDGSARLLQITSPAGSTPGAESASVRRRLARERPGLLAESADFADGRVDLLEELAIGFDPGADQPCGRVAARRANAGRDQCVDGLQSTVVHSTADDVVFRAVHEFAVGLAPDG